MEGEDNQSPYPLAPAANGRGRSDDKSFTMAHTKELHKKKRVKCMVYVAAFAVLQTMVILAFVLAVMHIKTPKFRLLAASFNLTDLSNSSISLRTNAQFTVKNTNFGHFKYKHGIVRFAYKGMTLGEAAIEKARARARSTRKVNATFTLSSLNLPINSGISNDLAGALLPLTSSSKLDGKVHLLKVFKKKKYAQMDCTMNINIGLLKIQNLKCK
jgi:hypothetical protein